LPETILPKVANSGQKERGFYHALFVSMNSVPVISR
jgi:hypothetical protein